MDEEPPIRILKRANWDKIKEEIQRDMNNRSEGVNLREGRRIMKETIDSEIEYWTNTVVTKVDENTPIRRICTLPHPKETDLLRLLQIQYTAITGPN